jgi:hypothetical protein
MRSSRDAHPRATSAVPSLEPSSTTIASQRSSVCATRDPSVARRVASMSKAGITTETATRLRSIPTVDSLEERHSPVHDSGCFGFLEVSSVREPKQSHSQPVDARDVPSSSHNGPRVRLGLAGELNEAAERIRETHVLDRLAVGLEEPR